MGIDFSKCNGDIPGTKKNMGILVTIDAIEPVDLAEFQNNSPVRHSGGIPQIPSII